MTNKQTDIGTPDSSRQEFDPQGFMEHAAQDEFLSSNAEFPVVYDTVKDGDDILKEDVNDPTKRRYLRVDVDAGNDRIVTEDQRIISSRIRSLFDARTMDAPYQPTWGRSYYSIHATEIDGKHIVPLSELLEKKRGECVEMATVTQLLAQSQGKKSYLVSGYLEEGSRREAHTWNVVEKNGGYYIFDAKNNFQSRITSVVFENGVYSFVTEKEVPFQYRLG